MPLSRLASAWALALALGLAPSSHAAPSVTGFTPASGPPGTLVKIMGSGLQGLTRVQFGDHQASTFWIVTPNHIKAEVPAEATTSPVIVVTSEGAAVSAQSFVVVRPLVTVPELALGPPRPNPARDAMRWSFVAPREGHARLVLFDVRGRKVRTLLDEWTSAGSHEVIWDGRDREGHRAAPGLYWARLDMEGVSRLARAVLLDE